MRKLIVNLPDDETFYPGLLARVAEAIVRGETPEGCPAFDLFGRTPGVDEDMRAIARGRTSDTLEVDDDAPVSYTDDGAWVAAWLWVEADSESEG